MTHNVLTMMSVCYSSTFKLLTSLFNFSQRSRDFWSSPPVNYLSGPQPLAQKREAFYNFNYFYVVYFLIHSWKNVFILEKYQILILTVPWKYYLTINRFLSWKRLGTIALSDHWPYMRTGLRKITSICNSVAIFSQYGHHHVETRSRQ